MCREEWPRIHNSRRTYVQAFPRPPFPFFFVFERRPVDYRIGRLEYWFPFLAGDVIPGPKSSNWVQINIVFLPIEKKRRGVGNETLVLHVRYELTNESINQMRPLVEVRTAGDGKRS